MPQIKIDKSQLFENISAENLSDSGFYLYLIILKKNKGGCMATYEIIRPPPEWNLLRDEPDTDKLELNESDEVEFIVISTEGGNKVTLRVKAEIKRMAEKSTDGRTFFRFFGQTLEGPVSGTFFPSGDDEGKLRYIILYKN